MASLFEPSGLGTRRSGLGTLTDLAAALQPRPPATIGGFDGVDTSYQFEIFGIDAQPARTNAVYMFCKLEYGTYVPLYIGRAQDLSDRLANHERKTEAINLGAQYLLVHTPPAFAARVGCIEAERRLIAQYNPVLNTQHRGLGALVGGL
ncbi:putative GIY-YIG superfamily endonuclease [Labrenzia sp. EL_142]|nr:putative GIY-YIG superfamily endonuclease [Labrenzia sp. EL_142]